MSARADEAADEAVTFTYDGTTYTVPPRSQWPMRVARLVESEKFTLAAEAILGPQQYATFEDSHTFDDAEAFFSALGEALGANPT